jgi:DNA repair exonuclease SbcCD ATPase subunit
MQLRREVLIATAEGLAGAQQAFFRFANTDIPFNKVGDFESGPPGWSNKLRLVASIETIEAFSTAEKLLGSAFFDLLRRRNLLQQADDQMNVTKQQIEHVTGYQEQMRALVARLSEQPPSQETVRHAEWAAEQFTEAQKQLEALTKELGEHVDARWSVHRDLFRRVVEHYAEYQKELTNALVALRREIELPIDLGRFQKVAQAHAEQVKMEISKILDGIEEDERVVSAG